jgi:hypothetical protein
MRVIYIHSSKSLAIIVDRESSVKVQKQNSTPWISLCTWIGL